MTSLLAVTAENEFNRRNILLRRGGGGGGVNQNASDPMAFKQRIKSAQTEEGLASLFVEMQVRLRITKIGRFTSQAGQWVGGGGVLEVWRVV